MYVNWWNLGRIHTKPLAVYECKPIEYNKFEAKFKHTNCLVLKNPRKDLFSKSRFKRPRSIMEMVSAPLARYSTGSGFQISRA